ncbi:hypothetical protein [Glutamicibacter soli]
MAPLIRMKALISGSRNGKKWPQPGQTLEVPEAEASQLIAQGIAVDADQPEITEATGKVETATAPAGNKSLADLRAEARAEAEDKLKAEAEAKAQAGAVAKAETSTPKTKES